MLEEIAGALGGDTLGQLAGVLGADNDAVGRGVAAALPAILGGLARNSREGDGASAIANAVGKDHDGSILDSLGMIFGGSPWAQQQATRHGERILGHVFGDRRPRVEQQVEASSGLSSGLVSKLLPLLAPIVMGYIGKRLAGGGGNEVAASLQQEREVVQQNDGMFGQILDMLDGDDDDDGGGLMDMAGDLLKGQAGKMLLGQLFGR
ncbi:MAG: DUF937 domain-containing protein [Actinomycetota bacterium]